MPRYNVVNMSKLTRCGCAAKPATLPSILPRPLPLRSLQMFRDSGRLLTHSSPYAGVTRHAQVWPSQDSKLVYWGLRSRNPHQFGLQLRQSELSATYWPEYMQVVSTTLQRVAQANLHVIIPCILFTSSSLSLKVA